MYIDPSGMSDLTERLRLLKKDQTEPAEREALRGGVAVADTPVDCYAELGAIVGRYAGRDIDLADAALIWLAGASGQNRILTVDERDFSAYRLKQGRCFDLIIWY